MPDGDGVTAKAAARRRDTVSPDERDLLVTVAGNGTSGFSGDERPAPQAQLAFPADVAVGQGAVFIADHANHRVRRIDGSDVLTTVAGDGLRGFAGDGTEAVRARLGFPAALAVDADGAVLIADEMNHRIRRIDPSGVIDTVAGDGSRGGDGDGGPADRARLDAPCALAVDGAGSLYVGEAGSLRVRRIGGDGVISTVVAASRGSAGSGAADAGEAFLPAGLAADAAGQLYIADPVGRRLLLLGSDGILRVLAGPPDASAGATAVDWSAPCAVAVDAQGAVYVADMNGHCVWRLADGAARVVAGPDPAAGEAAETGIRRIPSSAPRWPIRAVSPWTRLGGCSSRTTSTTASRLCPSPPPPPRPPSRSRTRSLSRTGSRSRSRKGNLGRTAKPAVLRTETGPPPPRGCWSVRKSEWKSRAAAAS